MSEMKGEIQRFILVYQRFGLETVFERLKSSSETAKFRSEKHVRVGMSDNILGARHITNTCALSWRSSSTTS